LPYDVRVRGITVPEAHRSIGALAAAKRLRGVSDLAGFDSEDHEAICHAPDFVETATPIGPVMQREHRERHVEGARASSDVTTVSASPSPHTIAAATLGSGCRVNVYVRPM
jgi:hypothetical protein